MEKADVYKTLLLDLGGLGDPRLCLRKVKN